MIKRVLTMVLAIMMLLSVTAGCGGTEEADSGPTTTVATTQTETTPAETPPPEKKLIELSIGWANVSRLENDDFGKYILDKFKIKINEVATDGNKIQMLASSNSLPDMFSGAVGDPFFNQCVQEGLIRDIPDTMMDKFPNLKKYAEKALRMRLSGSHSANVTLSRDWRIPTTRRKP